MYVYAAVSLPRRWYTGAEHTKIGKKAKNIM